MNKKNRRLLAVLMSLLLLLSAGIPTFAMGTEDMIQDGHEHNQEGWTCTFSETGREKICTDEEHTHAEDCYAVSGTWNCVLSSGDGMGDLGSSDEDLQDSAPSDTEKKIVSFPELDESLAEQNVSVGTTIDKIKLPNSLEATDTEGETLTILVTWKSTPEFDGETVGTYTFSPVLEGGYTVADGAVLPSIKIIVGQEASILEENSYLVGSADEYTKALEKIQKADSSEATIVLTADITLSSAFSGVEGKTILIRSQDNERHLLTFTEDILKLSGPLTFENVHITSHTIYANGHPLVLGEGFGGGNDGTQRMTVYGGSDQDLTANTDLTILDGVYKLLSGGNSAGTLTGNTHVKFGDNAQFPTAADEELEGDFVSTKSENYNLYLDAKGEDKWNGPVFAGMDYEYGILPYGIYGGGTCGNTVGNTEIVMTGGTVYQIFGGGAARRNPSHAGQLNNLEDLGRVSGNTSVTVTGGEVKSVYGGGYNDIFVYSSYEYEEHGVPADAREQRAVVEGNTYVEISGDAHVPAANQSEDTPTAGADSPAVYGGSFHSTVYNTEVVIGGNAKIESGEGETYGYGAVYGAGSNDIVRGTTSVKLTGNAIIGNDQNNAGVSAVSQKQFSAITPMGRSSKSQCYLGGAIFSDLSEIQNKDNKNYAAVAEVSGGSVDVLMAGVKSRTGSGQPLKTCNGNVQLKQSGGSVLAIESGSVYEKNLVIEGNVDILVTGGTTEEYILGRYSTSDLGDSEIKGACTLTFSGCGSEDSFRMSPLIWAMDSVQVTDDAHVAVFGDHTLYDSNKKGFKVPLYQVKDLTIDEGSVLAFSQEANITGDLAVNGALHMARVKKTINIGGMEIPIGDPKAITLTADGKATGNGKLLPIEAPKSGANYGTYFEPVVNEEYVYAQTADSNMELALAQGTDQFFVDRKNSDTAGQDVWFINEGQPAEMITVTYQWKGGDSANNIPKDVTLPGPDTIEKGSAYTAKQVTSATHTFDGWYLDEDYTQRFTDGTKLDKDTMLYGNWRVGTDEILWYSNVYIQKADGTYSDEPSKHGQGGWAAPDAKVSISSDDFNGEIVEQLELGTDVLYDKGYAKERLSAEYAIDAGKHNPLRIYYKRPYTVTYEYEGTVPQGAPSVPNTYYAYAGETAEVAEAPTMDGYVFDGWKVKSPQDQSINDGKLQPIQQNVVLSGKWTKEETPNPPVPEQKTGDLTVSKVVAGNKGETDRKFHFNVTLSNPAINGKYGDLEFRDGKATFTLKHNESITASDLPAGIEYTVEETEANQDDYTTASTGAKGTITENGAAAVFTNTRNSSEPDPGPEPGPGPSAKNGNLTVSKVVTGEKGEKDRFFTFKVTLSDTAVNGVYGDMIFSAGTAVFTLKHGERMDAEGLPAGIRYTVEESDNEGYTVLKSGDVGTIEAGKTALARFTNNRADNGENENEKPDPDKPNPEKPENPKPEKPDKPNPNPEKPDQPNAKPDSSEPGGSANQSPQTGDNTDLALWLTLAGICVAGISGLMVFGKRRTEENK